MRAAAVCKEEQLHDSTGEPGRRYGCRLRYGGGREDDRAGAVQAGRRARPAGPRRAGLVDAWWRAANYLAVGQIYLMGNPLLREPLRPEHIKPRLLGHFGTVPGLNLRAGRTPTG